MTDATGRARTPLRGRRSSAGLTVEDILDCAAELFAERGYRGTNLEHVARRLGVTRQALYYHFPKKHDILMALFDRVMSRLEHHADATFAEDPPDLFGALLRGHIRVVAGDIALLTVLITENAEIREPLHPEAAERRRAHNERLVEAYQRGVAAGTLRPVPDVRVAVNTVIGAANMLIRWYDPDGPLDPDDVAEQTSSLLEHGLLADAPEEGRAAAGRAARPGHDAGGGP